MKMPQKPPPFEKLFREHADIKRLSAILVQAKDKPFDPSYLHWDKLRRLKPPGGLSPEEWWLATKFQRLGALKPIPLLDKQGKAFQFGTPEIVLEQLHKIDVGAGASIGVPEPITNPQTRDRYLVRSLMEEAITSSQLEGAVTTREIAKQMIRTGRPPRDTSEQMILNNFITMQRITALKKEKLTPEMVFAIHKLVTEKTLEDPTAAGRFRRPDERRVVGDDFGEVFHEPPHAGELTARLNGLCNFATGKTPGYFVHPVLRAIMLHFWLAYDHPFVDGNGRTARALFYWSMLHSGYWLFEFISISTILRKAPAKYGRSFLYTETDDNDLTYFIVAQSSVIRQAIEELHAYIARKTAELREVESHVRALNLFNHRQADLIRHALKHPYEDYTIAGHRKSHNVVYQTARTDLLNLAVRGLLQQKKRGKKLMFGVPSDLAERLRRLEKEARKAEIPTPPGVS
ncbi:MAG: Fic family protein [Verrucomicrobia bacterium]|nr:Fic family protein [Verrucomicrobiota bacterium]